MSASVTKEQVRKIAELARLPLTEESLGKFQVSISSILEYVSTIQAMNTSNVMETSQVTGLTNVFREDIIEESLMLSQEDALSNANEVYEGYFVVPAVFE